jgi:phenylacetate-CoA ligase
MASVLEQTLHDVAKRSPYYRELFRDGVPRFADAPTLDKATLSARNADFLCVPRDQVAEIVTTSGTTGRPLLWMLTAADLQRLGRNEELSFTCAGLTGADTVLVAVTIDRCFIAGLAYWLGLQRIGCAVARVGISSPVMVLELIERLQPTAIVSVPSFLRIVANAAREKNFDLAGSSVTKAIGIGEPIRDAALQLNAAGRAIEDAWGAKVFSTYGVTELADSCCECSAGRGGHVHEELLHVEILDDAGQPVRDGEVGEIVATTLGVEAMPLLRYRTGDCAVLYREPCACGRTSPRVGPIVGRKNQKLKVKGTSVFPSALAAVLEETPDIDAFVIVARSDGNLADTVEVLVHGAAAPASLREAFQGRVKLSPEIRQTTRAEIEALQLPANARKRRYFVDLR